LKLIVLDIDNTLFDWVTYYVNSFRALLFKLEATVGVPFAQLAKEAKQVFADQHTIEYPFVIQHMPSVLNYYGQDVDRLLVEGVEPARAAFNHAAKEYLMPYAGVEATLDQLKEKFAGTPLVVLTDAPRYVAMWKLNKLGILHKFDAVYGLPDPKLPTSLEYGRVMVDPEILLKHLKQESFGYKGRIRVLPEDYEKPGTKGLKTVLLDFDLDSPEERRQVLWVGDNLRKDVGLGRSLGVKTVWARYGTLISPEMKEGLLAFSPDTNVKKNVSLDPAGEDAPNPDYVIDSFSEVLSSCC
jgi:phosphoglycolate phosphatase